ncbi:MAG: peptide ABC transporter substrate-binding protein [Sinobacteraceae bacterium]|nr:peptide ABC transporter substrate-binding protein [Nevskiaceae bacterium]
MQRTFLTTDVDRKRRELLLTLAATSLGTAALPGLVGAQAGSGDTAQKVLRTGHPGEPDSLDPHIAIAAPSLVVINDLFESLLTLDSHGRPIAGAAERYSVSPDGRIYTFTLRQGLQFSDGRPIDSADFLYSFRRLADPRTASTALAAWIDLIEGGRAVVRGQQPVTTLGVAAPDPRTVQIKLVVPAPYFPSIAAFPVFAPMPRHVIDQHGRNWTRPEYFVSNGPYVLDQWRPGQMVRAKRNPRFHAAASVKIDAIEYRPIIDLNAGLRMFQTGALDALTNFPPERLDWLRQNMPRELRLSPSLGITVYVINHRLPKFADPRVRRALSLAIDRDVITTRIVRAGDTPAWGIVPSGMSGYAPALKPPLGSQAERTALARRLLSDAGRGPSNPLEIELLYHTSEEHKKVAIAVAAMWQAIGVRATLRNAERQVVEVATRNGEFEIVRAAWFSPYADPMGYLGFLRRGSPQNGGAYDSAAYETAVDAAQVLTDPAARGRALRVAEQRLVDEQAVIPIYFLVSRRLISQRVVGWNDDSLTALRPVRWLDLR